MKASAAWHQRGKRGIGGISVAKQRGAISGIIGIAAASYGVAAASAAGGSSGWRIKVSRNASINAAKRRQRQWRGSIAHA